jgi:hypothetical protein
MQTGESMDLAGILKTALRFFSHPAEVAKQKSKDLMRTGIVFLLISLGSLLLAFLGNPFLLLIAALTFAIFSGGVFLLARLFGGKAAYKETFFALSMPAGMFSIIHLIIIVPSIILTLFLSPILHVTFFLFFIIAALMDIPNAIWLLYSQTVIIRELHRLSMPKAAIAVIVPAVVSFILFLLVLFLLFILILGTAMGGAAGRWYG